MRGNAAAMIALSICAVPFGVGAQEDPLARLLAALRTTPATTEPIDTSIFELDSAAVASAGTTTEVTSDASASVTLSPPTPAAVEHRSPFALYAINGTQPQSQANVQLESMKALLATLTAQLALFSTQTTIPVPQASSSPSVESSTSTPIVRIEITRNLTVGSRGDDVRFLQAALSELGFFIGEVTGYFGPLTRDAVRAFQADRGLSAVGNVGPLTRAAFNSMGETSVDATPGVATTVTGSSSLFTADETSSGPVVVNLTVLPTHAPVGGQVTVTWQSQNATSCEASDGWDGPRANIGAAIIEPLQFSLNLVLTCTGLSGVATASTTVYVGDDVPATSTEGVI